MKTTITSLTGLLFPALLLATPGLAQDGPAAQDDTLLGGALVTVDVGMGASYEDDSDQSLLNTQLGLGVFSQTRSQRFNFSIDTRTELSDADISLANVNGQLGYAIFNRYTEASVNLSYREVPIDDDPEPDTLAFNPGTRETHVASLQLITGRTTRFGTQTTLSYEQLDYVDSNDPDLVTRITYGANTNLRFSLSRQVELRAFASWREQTRDLAPQEVETTTRFGLGGTFLIDRAWTATTELGWNSLETEQGGAVTTEDGLNFNLGAVRAMPNGTLSFGYDHLVIRGDTIERLTIGRDLDLASGAAVTASAALVSFENGDVLPALGLTYDQEILRGRTLNLSLTQDGNVNADNESTFRTQFDIGYRQDLTPTSFVAASFSASAINVISGPSADSERASFGLQYGHALTRDWNLVARADHTRVYEAGTETDRNSLFSINLQRSFSFRP